MRRTSQTNKAYDLGREARHNGAVRSAPGRMPHTIEAWLDGWDDEDACIKDEQAEQRALMIHGL